MSDHLKHLLARFEAETRARSASGQGDAHLLSFMAECGRDLAGTVFLQFTTVLERTDPEKAEAVCGWVADMCDDIERQLIDAVRASFNAFACNDEPIVAEAERSASEAYAERLSMLLSGVCGGAA